MPVFAASIGTRIWDHVRFANYTPKMRWRGVQAYDLFDKCGVSCGGNGAGVVLQIQSPYWWNLTGSRLAVCLNESFTILLPRASQCAIAATLIHDTLLQRTTLGSERRNDSHEISSGKAAVRVDIIVVYVQRYRFGHETHFVPPITGIHLAAITPHDHQVRVIHQQVERIDFDTSADLIALSFFSGFAPEAYRLAQEFKKRGKRIVAGGPHATFAPDEVLRYCDSVVIGEAESVWTELLADAAGGRLRDRYVGKALPLIGIPMPRYDLLPRSFFIQRVVQATRGCPFTCSFCTVPTLNPGFRTRPVAEVIEDVKYDKFRHWWQRKVVWFWDDNLTINRPYIRTLLGAMIPLRKWWLTQASMDIAEDASLLDLMKWSGCIGIFFGIESFGVQSLKDAHKPQNMVDKYQAGIRALHDRGICVMAGFIAGFDSDTPESVVAMAKQLYDTGVDVPFLSVLTPYRGTPAYTKMASEGRILIGRGWEFYNGYNVSFNPKNMSPDQLLQAHRALWREAFSFKYSLLRIVRSFFRLRLGAFLMCAMMNGFYCLKRMRGNEPMTFGESSPCAQFTGLTSDAA